MSQMISRKPDEEDSNAVHEKETLFQANLVCGECLLPNSLTLACFVVIVLDIITLCMEQESLFTE
jgi:hypothetical protein